MRRATVNSHRRRTSFGNFYPRSPCGERHAPEMPTQEEIEISIHALLAESDVMHALKFADLVLFLSTLSLRRATTATRILVPNPLISIHALLAESDKHSTNPKNRKWNFYPRSPCGERPTYLIFLAKLRPFLSTLSLRRATSKI